MPHNSTYDIKISLQSVVNIILNNNPRKSLSIIRSVVNEDVLWIGITGTKGTLVNYNTRTQKMHHLNQDFEEIIEGLIEENTTVDGNMFSEILYEQEKAAEPNRDNFL